MSEDVVRLPVEMSEGQFTEELIADGKNNKTQKEHRLA